MKNFFESVLRESKKFSFKNEQDSFEFDEETSFQALKILKSGVPAAIRQKERGKSFDFFVHYSDRGGVVKWENDDFDEGEMYCEEFLALEWPFNEQNQRFHY